MKKALAVLSTITLLIMSFWLGETGRGLFQFLPYVIGLIGMVAIPCLISEKWKNRTVMGVLFIVFYAAAFYLGDLSFCRAYNTCIETAEQVRADLYDYKAKNGKYPDALNDLYISLPCTRYLRGTILEYESTGSCYKIGFKDWLVEHWATDKEPFIAHK